MSQSENLFDTAISQADDAILRVMGTVATITSGVLAGATLTGVFDDPESVSYAAGGVRIEETSLHFCQNIPDSPSEAPGHTNHSR